jgi:hypothetical protein
MARFTYWIPRCDFLRRSAILSSAVFLAEGPGAQIESPASSTPSGTNVPTPPSTSRTPKRAKHFAPRPGGLSAPCPLASRVRAPDNFRPIVGIRTISRMLSEPLTAPRSETLASSPFLNRLATIPPLLATAISAALLIHWSYAWFLNLTSGLRFSERGPWSGIAFVLQGLLAASLTAMALIPVLTQALGPLSVPHLRLVSAGVDGRFRAHRGTNPHRIRSSKQRTYCNAPALIS